MSMTRCCTFPCDCSSRRRRAKDLPPPLLACTSSRVSMSVVRSSAMSSFKAIVMAGTVSTSVSISGMLFTSFDIPYLAQPGLDLLTPDLRIAHGGLDGRRAVGVHMPQVVGHLLQRQVLAAQAMPEIVAQIVEGDVIDQSGFLDRCLQAHLLEPLVDAV